MFDQRIHTFLALCDKESYTKAAEDLFITQPAVTQHIKLLEKKYKTKLFTYSNRQLKLTESGKEFKRYLQEGLAREKLMIEKINELDKGQKNLKFGATLTIGEFTIAPFIKEFYSKFKDYNISLQVDNTKVLMDELNKGSIEFVLIEGLFRKADYHTKLLEMKEFVLVVSPENPLAKKTRVNLGDILNQTLIIREKGSGSREILERSLSERNYSLDDFKDFIRIGNINLMKHMVQEGLGISFMYEDAVLNELKTGSLVKIKLENFKILREFNFVSLRDLSGKDQLDIFYEYFKSNINRDHKKGDGLRY